MSSETAKAAIDFCAFIENPSKEFVDVAVGSAARSLSVAQFPPVCPRVNVTLWLKKRICRRRNYCGIQRT
jgi:hypothetical protein